MSAASRKFKKVAGPVVSFIIGVVAAVIMPDGKGVLIACGGGVVAGVATNRPGPCVVSGVIGFIAWYAFAKHVLHTVA